MPLSESLSDLKGRAQKAEIVVAKTFNQHRKQLIQTGAALALGTSMIAGFPNTASATTMEVEQNDTYNYSQDINFQMHSAVTGTLSPSIEIEGEGYGVNYGDVDFFTFTGLTSGARFYAETDASDLNSGTILGWFSSDGTRKSDNANGSKLSGTVDPTGEILLGVSGFNDFSFVGDHNADGQYKLTINEVITPVPEPGTASLLLTGLAGIAAFFRKRKK